MLRRRLLTLTPLLPAILSAACRSPDTQQNSSPTRPETRLLLLAPQRPGRAARLRAWNRRFFDQTRVTLDLAPVFDARDALARAVRADQLAAFTAQAPNAGHLVLIDFADLPALALRRRLQPLTDLVRRDRYDLKRFMPQALQPAYAPDGPRGQQRDHQLCGLPESVDAHQLYFNAEHAADAGIDVHRAGLDFQNPIMTWETFRQVGLDLVSAPRARERLAFHPGAESAPLEPWGWQNGAEWLSADGRRATFAGPAQVEALAWLAALAREVGGPAALPAPGAFPDLTPLDTGPDVLARHAFLAGRVSTAIDSARLVSAVAGWRPDFPLGYVEVPRRRWETPPLTFGTAAGLVVIAGAHEAAWDALRFLVDADAALVDATATAAFAPVADPSPETRAALGVNAPSSGRALWFPPFTGQLRVDRWLADLFRTGAKRLDEARDYALEQVRHARSRPPTPAAADLWPLLQEARRQALAGARRPDEALADAQRAAQSRLDAAWAALE